MRQLLYSLTVAGIWLAASTAQGQPQNTNQDGTSVRGKVVRVEGQDRIIVQTSDNKEVTLLSTPTTRYVINGKAGRFADVRNGATLRATYNVQDNRYVVNSLQIGDESAPGQAPGANDRRFSGRVVRIDAPNNKIMARTQDGRDVTLMVAQNARLLRNGVSVKLAEIQVGTMIETVYVERDNHWWVEEVTLLPEVAGNGQPAPAADGTQVQGTVVRIVGQNQVVIRTSDNKELTIDLQPKTVYLLNDQPSQLNAFQPGHDVRIIYNVNERRNLASRILGTRR